MPETQTDRWDHGAITTGVADGRPTQPYIEFQEALGRLISGGGGGGPTPTNPAGVALTTSPATVLSLGLTVPTLIAVHIDLALASGTTVTLTLSYTDPNLGLTSITIVNATPIPGGPATVPTFLISATTATTITLTGSAGADGAATVYASFEPVGT